MNLVMAYFSKPAGETQSQSQACRQSSAYRGSLPNIMLPSDQHLAGMNLTGNCSESPDHLHMGEIRKPYASAIELAHFDMFIQDKSTMPPTHIHRITSLPSSGERPRRSPAQLPDRTITSSRLLELSLPNLARLWQEGSLSPDTQVIWVKASIQFMTSKIPEHAELAIQFELSNAHGSDNICELDNFDIFECETTFYQTQDGDRDSQQLYQSRKSLEYDREYKRLGNVPFGSEFWARRFMETGTKLREVQRIRKKPSTMTSSRQTDPAREARQLEQQVRDSVSKLTAVQEIFGIQTGPGDSKTSLKLLVACWSFEQAASGREGEMTWQNVILPPLVDSAVHFGEPTSQATSFASSIGVDQKHQGHDDLLALQLPNHVGYAAMSHPTGFEPQSSLDFNLSPLQPLQIPPLNVVSHDLSATLCSANGVDFAGGHIQLCLDGTTSAELIDVAPSTFGPYAFGPTMRNELQMPDCYSHSRRLNAFSGYRQPWTSDSQQSSYDSMAYFDSLPLHSQETASQNCLQYGESSSAGANLGNYHMTAIGSPTQETHMHADSGITGGNSSRVEEVEATAGASGQQADCLYESHADDGPETSLVAIQNSYLGRGSELSQNMMAITEELGALPLGGDEDKDEHMSEQ